MNMNMNREKEQKDLLIFPTKPFSTQTKLRAKKNGKK